MNNDYIPAANGPWSSKILRKAEKMRELKDKICFAFNLPLTEYVIQDYYGSCNDLSQIGHLYITPSYICFMGSNNIIHPFRSIINMVYNTDLLINSITIHLESSIVLHFYCPFQCSEAYALLNHINLYPPSFITPPSNMGHLSMGTTSLHVNLQTVQKAHQLAQLNKDRGIDILSELTQQGETLMRIDNTAIKIHNNLDQSNRLINSIQSGPLCNLFTSNPTPLSGYVPTISEMKTDELIIPILLKLNNDSLISTHLCLGTHVFSIPQPNSQIYNYTDIQYITVRSRPLHLDLHLSHLLLKRIRFVSSHIQVITSELVRRCNLHKPSVLFEPHSIIFVYDDPMITYNKSSISISNLLSHNIDAETKNDVRKAEEHLSEIFRATLDLEHIADQIGTLTLDQTQHLKNILDKVDFADQKLLGQTQELHKINRKL